MIGFVSCRALGISNVVKVNQEVSMASLQSERDALKAEVAQLKAQLQGSRKNSPADTASKQCNHVHTDQAPGLHWVKAPRVVLSLVLIQTVLLMALQW